ncbi:DUF4395 domain-containing protein [Myxococcota bacterium]|nr:DUF4395 domain-containing protein [Myxococcota bacterium]MBU1411950.1 DUF4395 domain-containing protein [Myxococcota bacterium]MBU1511407.1 DUF4395 domain-containing protein [Myxococcota bacterium]
MNSLVCPVSSERVSTNVVRVTGSFIVLGVAAFAVTGISWILPVLGMDFFIRGFGSPRFSPLGRLAAWIVAHTLPPGDPIDRAPKMFAARVGFLFAMTALGLSFFWPQVALGVALALGTFAALECVFNLCVGCFVYTNVVRPLAHR